MRPDVVVVGGGVLGLAVGRELARQGAGVQMVYPEHRPGMDSATLAAGAMIDPFGELTRRPSDPLERARLEFRIRARDGYRAWLGELRQETGRRVITNDGMFMVGNDVADDDSGHLARIREELSRYAQPFEEVTPTDVPGLRPKEDCPAREAIFIPGDLTVDSRQLHDALTSSVGARPEVRRVDDWVVGIHPEGGGDQPSWRVMTRAHGALTAPAVVVCAGARVPQAMGAETLRRLGLPTLYFIKGISAVVTGARALPHAIRTPNRSAACGLHLVPRADGRLYIGASSHAGHAPAAARGVTAGEAAAILGYTIRELNSALRDATIEALHVGLRPVTGDGSPLIGRTALPGLFLATGTLRTGIIQAPLIAGIVAAEVLGGEPPFPNPFAAVGPRRRKLEVPGDRPDDNEVFLHLDAGLDAYNRWRAGGGRDSLRVAVFAWRLYARLAGDRADERILDLLGRMEASPDPDPESFGVW